MFVLWLRKVCTHTHLPHHGTHTHHVCVCRRGAGVCGVAANHRAGASAHRQGCPGAPVSCARIAACEVHVSINSYMSRCCCVIAVGCRCGCEARGQDRADTLVYRNHTTSTLRAHYSYYSLLPVSRADFSDHLRGLFVVFVCA